MLVYINVEHPTAHIHTQNGLAESLIKQLQMIARLILLTTKLSLFTWGHAILHFATSIQIYSTTNHEFSHFQLVLNQMFHIYVFLVVLSMFSLPHLNVLS